MNRHKRAFLIYLTSALFGASAFAQPLSERIVLNKETHQVSLVVSHWYLMIISLFALFAIITLAILAYIAFRSRKVYRVAAYTDHLTGIWNSRKFEEEASKIIARNPDKIYALIQADIRDFKFLNNMIGLQNANKILCRFADNLKQSPIPLTCYCRDYADRFCILMEVNDVFECLEKSEILYNYMSALMQDKNYKYVLKFGVAPIGRDFGYTTIQASIGQAKYANASIKGDLVNNVALLDDGLYKNQIKNQELETNFDDAIRNKEFFVVYQPKNDMNTGKIIGAEALVRWRTEAKGVIAPNIFIPVLEKDGYVMKLDFYVYERVFEFVRQRISNGKRVVPVSVNMSRAHLLTYNFVHHFVEVFNRYNIPTSSIQIEVLERATGETDVVLQKVVEELQNHGFKVAMDDFGSGESSLNMLHSIPVNIIKLDRQFLYEAEEYEDSKIIIAKVIDMAQELGKEVVCEGVETQAQVNFLKAVGCNTAQGYYYSRPLELKDFELYLDSHI